MGRNVAVLSLALLFGCAPTAEEAARVVLAIPADQEVDPVSVRRSALALFPVGTPDSAVVSYLKDLGIPEGTSGLAFYLATDSELVLRFDDARSFGVAESYGVRLGLDDQRRVKGVEVQRWLTGL